MASLHGIIQLWLYCPEIFVISSDVIRQLVLKSSGTERYFERFSSLFVERNRWKFWMIVYSHLPPCVCLCGYYSLSPRGNTMPSFISMNKLVSDDFCCFVCIGIDGNCRVSLFRFWLLYCWSCSEMPVILWRTILNCFSITGRLALAKSILIRCCVGTWFVSQCVRPFIRELLET